MAIDPALLARHPIFARLASQHREVLTHALRERRYSPDDVICRAGDKAWTGYVILDGAVRVIAEGFEPGPAHGIADGIADGIPPDGTDGTDTTPGTLATLGPGELFGEVGLVDGGVRSATCVAGPDGALLAELDRPAFERIFNAGNAFAYRLMDMVAAQLARHLQQASEVLLEAARADTAQRDAPQRDEK